MSEKHHQKVARAEQKDLGRASMRSGMINLGSQGVSVLLQILSTVVLARMLTPSAYGIIGMVATVTSFASLFKDLGLSAATIQRKDLTEGQLSMMFWVNIAVGLLITLSITALSPLVAWFYDKPELLAVTCALACNILLSSLGAQHAALLTRHMRFGPLACCRLSSALVTFLVAFAAAWCGWQHWALVVGMISGSLTQVTLLWMFSGWRPGRPRRGTGARSMVRYGLNLTGFDFVNYFSRNLDNILIGRFLGPVTLGYYTRGYSLLMFPISNIRGPLISVALPALSQLQHDKKRFCAYYRQLVGILAMLTMPVSAFCVVASELIVLTLLGEQWLPVAEIARWLALASLLQPVSGVFGAVLMAQGLANRHFRCGVAGSIVFTLSFCVGINWGIEGLLGAFVLANYGMFLPIFLYASKGTGIHLRDFVESVWRPASASVLAACVAWHICPRLVAQWPVLELALQALFYGLVYLLLYSLLPGGLGDIKRLWLRFSGALRSSR